VSEAPLVEVRTDGGVRVLTLRREAKLNALSTALEQALAEALAHAGARCFVLTGSGRAFSVGADIGELRERTPEAVLAYYAATGGVYEQLAALPQPTISAIGGYCLGGGLELALATDFRIADETAVFAFPEVGLGILPSSGGTERVTRLLGPARAKELVLLRERIDAHEALAYGLVTEVVPAGKALDRALAIAHELAALPSLAASLAKQAIDAVPESSRAVALLIERLAYATLAQTEDAHAAAEAFERRRE
jgi:enoyl-CoA hydratase/carnithine racemase